MFFLAYFCSMLGIKADQLLAAPNFKITGQMTPTTNAETFNPTSFLVISIR